MNINLSPEENKTQITETSVEELQEIKQPTSAALRRRLLGFLVDYSLILFLDAFIMYTTSILFPGLYFVYCILFESIFCQTLGKVITRTIVVKSGTFEKPSFWQILGRTLSRFIPFDCFFIWHDNISRTMVTTVKEMRIYNNLEKDNTRKKNM